VLLGSVLNTNMNDFNSFCTRMWLDNEDENLSLPGNRLTRDEYVERWHDWLVDKWQNHYSDSCGGTPVGWISEKEWQEIDLPDT